MSKRIKSKLPQIHGRGPDVTDPDYIPAGHERLSATRGPEIDYWLANNEKQWVVGRYLGYRTVREGTKDERTWHLVRLEATNAADDAFTLADPENDGAAIQGGCIAIGELFALRPLRDVETGGEVFIRWDEFIEGIGGNNSYWDLTVSVKPATNSRNSRRDNVPF